MFLLPATSFNFWQLVAKWRNFVEGNVSTFVAVLQRWLGRINDTEDVSSFAFGQTERAEFF